MTGSEPILKKHIKRFSVSESEDREESMAIEEPLEIQVSYNSEDQKKIKKTISVTMRTPGSDEELAVGFLFTEGIIRKPGQVREVRSNVLDANKVAVQLQDGAMPEMPETDRNFYTTSSCGVCGKSSIEAIKTVSMYEGETACIQISAGVFLSLASALSGRQEIFQRTGGLHASAIFDLAGSFLILREDVGRHNALDKVIGRFFLDDRLPLNNEILLLSGRASFELIQKAVMAGIKIVAAIGAPSSLAVQLAEESGITLIGFLRSESFNIYSGIERVTDL